MADQVHYSEVNKVVNTKFCNILAEVNRSWMERNKLIVCESAQFANLAVNREDFWVQSGSYCSMN